MKKMINKDKFGPEYIVKVYDSQIDLSRNRLFARASHLL